MIQTTSYDSPPHFRINKVRVSKSDRLFRFFQTVLLLKLNLLLQGKFFPPY